MLLMWMACQGPEQPEDTGLGYDQPDWDTPGARRWTNTGGWYPTDPDEMDAEVQALLDAVDATPQDTQAVLVPHARLISSGAVAADAYARMADAEVVILLVPNHGAGQELAIWTEGPWLVPGHSFQVDEDITARVQELLPELVTDRDAFQRHPPEMQLPFLKLVSPEARVVAVALRDTPEEHFEQGFDVETVDAWGEAFATVLTEHPEAVLVTSTDLTHYLPAEPTEEQSAAMLARIEAFDVPGLYEDVTTQELSICGELPTAVMMSALTQLGYDAADHASMGDSRHVASDPESLIGYPAVVTYRETNR